MNADETLEAIKPLLFDARAVRYWQDIAAGQLTLGFCESCHRVHHHPRPLCPFCLNEATTRPASGRGEIYSCTPVAADGTWSLSIVNLEEGTALLTYVERIGDRPAAIGDQVVFRPFPVSEDLAIPVFRTLPS
jgi:uncharacterized OB-fold protein